MSRLKITNGDLLFINVTYGTSLSKEWLIELDGKIRKWLASKGLSDVQLEIYGGSGAGFEITYQVLSVNDVFEDTVLR